MKNVPLSWALGLMFLMGLATPAAAQRTHASNVEMRIVPDAIELTLVVHVFDIAHDLEIEPPERMLEPATLSFRGDAIIWMLRSRIQLAAGDNSLGDGSWTKVEALPERQSIRLSARYAVGGSPGTVTLKATMFPYDSMHQTFVKFYENDMLTAEAILDHGHTQFEYFSDANDDARP